MIGKLLPAFLAVAACTTSVAMAQTSPQEVEALPASAPTLISRYGPSPMQFGELRVPPGRGPFPVAIVIHGGCWLREFASVKGTAAIASALADRGIATWNIEYRALGDQGAGWPGTWQDWGAAADHLRTLAGRYPLDLKRVVAIGHSAGAPAAVYLAARPRLSAGSQIRGRDPLRLAGAVAIDGPPDITRLLGPDAEICGQPVIARLMGGTPEQHPMRYSQGSPGQNLPLGAPVWMVSASPVLRREWAEAYRTAAEAKGDRVGIVYPAGGDHFNVIHTGKPQWREVQRLIIDQAFAPRRR
ncbi:MAG TPA: alpha/beta hydrolase [Allosphingosinicella sp.]|nr:alpha/beta hydrolase [Allosphingosinicella sp.]